MTSLMISNAVTVPFLDLTSQFESIHEEIMDAVDRVFVSGQFVGGDEVILPANSFFATAEAVSNVGARPVFADVNPRTFHLDVASSERLITARTKAIIPVHLYGWAMDMRALQKLADQHRLTIIEDA